MFKKTSVKRKWVLNLSNMWFLYFVFSYALYLITPYSHYISTLFIMVMTYFANRRSTIRMPKSSAKIFIYFSLFYAWVLASYIWAGWKNSTQKTIIISSVEIVIMLFCMMSYGKSKKRLLNLIEAFVSSTLICAVLYYATSPISQWGTTAMGTRMSIWRNSAGYYFMFAAIFSLYIYLQMKKKRRYLIIAFILMLAAIGTGSRKVFVQIAIATGLYVFTEKSFGKKVKIISLGLCAVVLLFAIGSQIPSLKSLYEGRLLSIFTGAASNDSSTITRLLLQKKAIALFGTSPLIGRGLNAFTSYIGLDVAFLKDWAISPTYSHCNYTELLANGGIICFLLYYVYPIKQAVSKFKKREDIFKRLGLIVIVDFIILDYATISYYMRIYIIIFAIGMMLLMNANADE
ncbi:MAG: O-antigen ligase family protein [Clostridia bacterium]|nr:O-antigen ligase family protein [Clostridia bacterium]